MAATFMYFAFNFLSTFQQKFSQFSVGHRASFAMSILKTMGYQRVYNLLGGMTAWSKLKCRKLIHLKKKKGLLLPRLLMGKLR